MIFKFDNKIENMEGDTNMGKKNKGNSNPVIDINAIKDEIFNGMSEAGAGFENSNAKDNWEEPQKTNDQMSKEEFNSDYNELQKKNEDDERLKQRLRMQNVPSLSNKTRIEEEKEKSSLWSFSPVIPVYKNGEIIKYICTISAFDLATYFEKSVVKFIPSIQRGSKILPSGKEKDNFSTKHVSEIFKAYTENKIFGNTIVLNYSLDNDIPLVYNPEKNKISGEVYLQMVDCSHRARAASKWKSAWSKHPEQYDDPRQFQFSCEVNNISDNSARQMFAEYNNFSLKVNKTRSSYLDIASDVNKIVRRIMTESDLKVETVSTSIKSSSPSIVTFGVLTNAIKANYNPQTKLEQKNIENWLILYFDELVSIFPKFMANSNLEERNSLKKQFFTIEPLAFGAYIALSVVLRDDLNWKEKLAKLKQDDFLLRSKPHWRPVLRNEDKVINTTASAKYFNEKCIEWCTK